MNGSKKLGLWVAGTLATLILTVLCSAFFLSDYEKSRLRWQEKARQTCATYGEMFGETTKQVELDGLTRCAYRTEDGKWAPIENHPLYSQANID